MAAISTVAGRDSGHGTDDGAWWRSTERVDAFPVATFSPGGGWRPLTTALLLQHVTGPSQAIRHPNPTACASADALSHATEWALYRPTPFSPALYGVVCTKCSARRLRTRTASTLPSSQAQPSPAQPYLRHLNRGPSPLRMFGLSGPCPFCGWLSSYWQRNVSGG
jgi:hypothetical protein